MSHNRTIRLVHLDTLSCEPIVRRMPNGELLCVCQCGGTYEPAPENREVVFHSKDNGKTWSDPESIMPECGRAVYCTEVSVHNGVVRAFITTHLGHFVDWRCTVLESRDNGYTWENIGPIPHVCAYTFVRGLLVRNDGSLVYPYHSYPISRELTEKLIAALGATAHLPYPGYAENGVIISTDGGKSFEKYVACRLPSEDKWVYSEPTLAQLSDGKIVMLMRNDKTGCLWRCESNDGGMTWSEPVATDIPNPGCKVKLIQIPDGRIVLLHTPNKEIRYPFEAWISDDEMKTWGEKILLTDYPGKYDYSDGFYEDGHLYFTIEVNRRDVLFFDMEI